MKLFLKKKSSLEKEIDSVVETLSELSPYSQEYGVATSNLEVLYKARSHATDGKVSADTKLVVLGNLLGIVLILAYEKASVITSRAIGFIIKGRV